MSPCDLPEPGLLIVSPFPLESAELTRVARTTVPHARVRAVDGIAAARTALASAPDIHLMLVDLDGHDRELSFLKHCRSAHPRVPVAVIGSRADIVSVVRAVEAGVVGYLPKTMSVSALSAALARLLEGGIALPEFATSRPGATALVQAINSMGLSNRDRTLQRPLAERE